MDATPYLLPRDAFAQPVAVSVGRRVALFRVRDEGGGRYVAAGWPSFLEFAFDDVDPSASHALDLTGVGPGDLLEVWWRGEGQKWSETRSIRLRPRPGGGRLLPLDQLPHWNHSEARRLRLLFHAAGPVALGGPRLVR